MDIYETLKAVVKELKNLFSDKNELCGFDDWDRLIGCVMMLEQLANSFSELSKSEEGEDNG